MTGLTDEQRIENRIAKELIAWARTCRERHEQWYPEDVFPPVQRGEVHTTVEGAAAAMARHVYRVVASNLMDRAIELTHDEPADGAA